jgi:hypothetical protein
MSSLTEIERAADALPLDQQESLFVWLSGRLHAGALAANHRIVCWTSHP